MHVDYISEHNVVERYVLGQLSEQEQIEFELSFLENPAILDEVERCRALQRGLRQHQAELQAAVADSKPSLVERLAGYFQSPLVLASNFAAIAALLVLVSLPPSATAPDAFTAEAVWLGAVRGADPAPAPPPLMVRSSNIVLDIDVGGDGEYLVELVDKDGQAQRSVRAAPVAPGSLLVVMRTADLAPGHYTLMVQSTAGEVEVSRQFHFPGGE